MYENRKGHVKRKKGGIERPQYRASKHNAEITSERDGGKSLRGINLKACEDKNRSRGQKKGGMDKKF